MEQQQQGPDDEDDFLESLRRAAARTSSEGPSAEGRRGVPARPTGSTERATPEMPRVSTATVDALRTLEDRIAALEEQVRRMNDDRDRAVADVADAVVARLDARWARSLSELGDDPG